MQKKIFRKNVFSWLVGSPYLSSFIHIYISNSLITNSIINLEIIFHYLLFSWYISMTTTDLIYPHTLHYFINTIQNVSFSSSSLQEMVRKILLGKICVHRILDCVVLTIFCYKKKKRRAIEKNYWKRNNKTNL